MFQRLCSGREVIYDPNPDGSFSGAVKKGVANPVKNPFAHWKICHAPDTSWLLIPSHPCTTRNEYSMCVDAGRQVDKGCSFWVAAGSHINQSKSSPSFSSVLLAMAWHMQLILWQHHSFDKKYLINVVDLTHVLKFLPLFLILLQFCCEWVCGSSEAACMWHPGPVRRGARAKGPQIL